MNKSLKIAKMNITDIVKPILIFYSIIVTILTFIVVMSNSGMDTSVNGIESATVIFIFVCGLNSFKENFYFAQSNNISRKSFITGIIVSTFPITMAMAIIDLIINRIINIFISMPSLYDMIYGNYKLDSIFISSANWVQDNSIVAIVNNIISCFVLYSLAYLLGLVINMIFYRCDTLMKILTSIVGVLLLNGIVSLSNSHVVKYILGRLYLGLISGIGILIILSTIAFLLVRSAMVKGK